MQTQFRHRVESLKDSVLYLIRAGIVLIAILQYLTSPQNSSQKSKCNNLRLRNRPAKTRLTTLKDCLFA